MLNILLAEDNFDLGTIMAEELEKNGYAVALAHDGEEACAQLLSRLAIPEVLRRFALMGDRPPVWLVQQEFQEGRTTLQHLY